MRHLRWLGRPAELPRLARVVTGSADPWARGGYAVFGPAFDPLDAPLLRRPFGRVFFAGEHTSEHWQGFMNGAVESGLRAPPTSKDVSGSVDGNRLIVNVPRTLYQRQGRNGPCLWSRRLSLQVRELLRIHFDVAVHSAEEVREHSANHEVAAGFGELDGLDAILEDGLTRSLRRPL